uniref:Sema domain-containing protein n=1 Tax=Pseudonaja textilis TaxID=8673 RepID=A0A670XU62_PSETE
MSPPKHPPKQLIQAVQKHKTVPMGTQGLHHLHCIQQEVGEGERAEGGNLPHLPGYQASSFHFFLLLLLAERKESSKSLSFSPTNSARNESLGPCKASCSKRMHHSGRVWGREIKTSAASAECNNYILVVHKINATNLYVCGTNAFHPVIDNMKLKLYTRAADSRGRCPYEPTVSYASLMVDGALYTATSNNFLGTEPIILRSFRNPLRTEYKASWLNEPTFVHMELIQENEAVSDSDRIYVFFTETATEFEFYDKLRVSRVAQLCKGDLGGKRTLKKRWTSFLKSTLLCSVPELQFQFNILQDVFVVKNSNWRETIIYGIFTQQWGKLDISAVCAFQMETIQDIFLKGSFKDPVALENSHMKWVMYRGDVPTPRPGACADVSALHLGYTSSLDLPDKVLQFVRDHPLMDSIVNSVGLQPVFLKRGTKYTQLIISQTTDLDNVTYDIFFLGTDKGYLHKTLNCHGEIIILEEIQLFPSAEPVQILKLASLKVQHCPGLFRPVVCQFSFPASTAPCCNLQLV